MHVQSIKKNKLGKDLLLAKFFGKKKPLFIGWDLTYRCNLDCKYCKIPQVDSLKELSTEDVCVGIEQLSSLGTQRIHFGGGEVLLRSDLGEIVGFCRKKGITTVVLTNGVLFEEKIDILKHADLVKISFDGSEKIHDELRGKGSFKKALRAFALSSKNGIKIALSSSLHAGNKDQIEFILKVANDFKIPVKFQIINSFLSGNKDISSYQLSDEQRKKILKELMEKKKMNRYIINSMAALQYMHDYPKASNISCAAGAIYARINAEGYLYPCQMMQSCNSRIPYTKKNIKTAFLNMEQVDCRHCLCTTTLELNLMYSLKLGSIVNGLKKF